MIAGAGLRISIDPDDVRDASRALDGADAELRDIVASIQRANANRLPALSFSTGAVSSQLSSVERRIGGLASDYQRYSAWLRSEADRWEQLDRGEWAPGDPWWPGLPFLIGAGAASLWDIVWRTWPWRPSGRPTSPVQLPSEIGRHTPGPVVPPGVAEAAHRVSWVPPFGTNAQARVDAWYPTSVRKGWGKNDCVSWAFFRRHELGLALPGYGNGGDLGKSQYQPSFLVPGTMVSYGAPGTFGHVMIIEKVISSDPHPAILVSEMNADGKGSGPQMTRVWRQTADGHWQSENPSWPKAAQDLRFSL